MNYLLVGASAFCYFLPFVATDTCWFLIPFFPPLLVLAYQKTTYPFLCSLWWSLLAFGVVLSGFCVSIIFLMSAAPWCGGLCALFFFTYFVLLSTVWLWITQVLCAWCAPYFGYQLFCWIISFTMLFYFVESHSLSL